MGPQSIRMLSRRAACLGASGLVLSGCASLGARRLSPDRMDYAERLRASEKEQMLANIVALRHGDSPFFLSVTSVINQYTREASANLSVQIAPPSDSADGSAGGAVLLRETPTITYTPLAGERFARSLLSPIGPASLIAMIEAGWAADDLFRVAVRSINGVRNASHAPLFAQPFDPAFEEVIGALRRLQRNGVLSVRLLERDKGFVATGRLRSDLGPADAADLDLVRRRLKLDGSGQELRIVFAAEAGGPGELAIVTRSIFELLQEMSLGVEAGPEAAAEGPRLLRVLSGGSPPRDAHVAIRQRGRWYWIAGDDERSKRVFLLAQVLLSLTDDARGQGTPLVTIPAG